MAESARAVAAAICEHWAVPGCAVVAVDRHGVVFSHRFGFADLVAGTPVEPQHRFEIGSISKVFTSMVMLRLARRELIRLADPVGAVLDWLPEPLRGADITIERLLNHTAGLVAGVDALPDELGQAAAFGGEVSPAEPGTFFHYSNLGFILAGLVARQVSGRPLPDLVRDEILRPLGMTSTIARVTHDDYPSLARGYQPLRDDRPWIPGDPLVQAPWLEVAGADGNIAATASDMARFARMLLGRGTVDDTTVLDAHDFDIMVSSTAPDGEDIPVLPGVPASDASRYGLGINTERNGGRMVLSHGGGMVGYASFLLADLDDGMAVCVLTNANGDSPVAEAIARSVAAELRRPGTVPVGGLDPHWWSADDTRELLGEFAGPGGQRVRVGVEERDGDRVRLALEHVDAHAVERAALVRTWSRGAVARTPSLDMFTLVFRDGVWMWGPKVFGGPHPAAGTESDAAALAPLCGHYRCYSPWFTNFRVVARGGGLVLIAAGGVEAPTDHAELVAVGGSTFRIGTDTRLPEHLVFGPVIGGVAAWVDRDGCRYSRAFTD
ncbi:serine hydrolase domain-containing protein [Mycolicibacterium sp. 120266]|uniref:serine hydrolase domain-containing protein n=1 Tax=Mycolicibacterium sp. 120266 TaxID=3090601 RepID=UPI00299EA67F|nr:serine hydrolase domain-containing protein [Mycolicibacterium sp. 120266]MDX1875907.1 serine hydrolase domain-containing protein [Mycolicibacterium sp. 120266]